MEAELWQTAGMDDRFAKEFFIRRIVEQAKNDGVQVSETEKQMLDLRVGDPNSLADPGLSDRIKKEIKKAEFERKISWLVKGGYEEDMKNNEAAKAFYKRAFKALKPADFYLHSVVDKGIGRDINKVGLFFGNYPTARGFVLKIIFFGIFFIAGIGIFFENGKISYASLKANRRYIFPYIVWGVVLGMNILGYLRFKKDDYYRNKKKH